jgi:hypothetical protein
MPHALCGQKVEKELDSGRWHGKIVSNVKLAVSLQAGAGKITV